MLTQIRNAMMVGQTAVAMPSSKIKAEIARILLEEGYIESYEVVEGEKPTHLTLKVKIKYAGERRERRPVMSGIVRVSRPGRRVYSRRNDISWVLSGLGITILSTPKGIMTGQRARTMGVGGEILCKVW